MPRSQQRFSAIYGSRPLHLLTMVSGFALLGYMLATFNAGNAVEPGTWWQSIAVWFAAAVVAHDLLLFPLYALADRMLFTRSAGDPAGLVGASKSPRPQPHSGARAGAPD